MLIAMDIISLNLCVHLFHFILLQVTTSEQHVEELESQLKDKTKGIME